MATYRELQELNEINQTGALPLSSQHNLSELLQQQRYMNPYDPLMSSSGPMYQSPQVVQSHASGSRGYGESQYDRRGIGLNQEEFGHIDDLRARNQSAIDQLSNGIAKGTALAGTTLLDGTIGMLYGIGAAINRGEWSGLWDNEVSNTLHDVNQQMEDYFQNYLTDEAKRNEAKGQWYKNLDTVNWWAENVVKNAGFMVGAYYSGLGWSKLLGALGKTIQAAKSAPNFVLTVGRSLNGGIARAAMGVFTSAVNEGRIEANNNSTDAFNIKAGQLENAFTEQQASIMNNPQYSDEEKEILLEQLQDTKAQRYQELDEMRRNMGTADMIMNLPILMLSETIAWGRAFAGGSKAALKANVLGSGTKHVGDNVSKIGMAARGLGRGVSEGMEEMNQAAASNISGYRLMPGDSPDAWHLALIDPESNLKTMDTYNSILKSLKDTYGKGASWLEFVAGAIPGLGGQVTIGKSNNMSDETWLGRGQFIGLTGGIGGSIYGDIRQNRINDEYAEYMNNYFGKRLTELRDIARSMSFNDGAETAAFNGDTFELKNQEDNDFFAAVSRFNAAGRLSELKESLTGPLGEIIDEAEKGNSEPLANLVTSTINPERRTSPWIDGFQASDDTELRTKIADAINNPKQRKYIIDKLKAKKKFIEDGIDRFSTIRDNFAEQYPMLQDAYIDELSWLLWKSERFSDRAKDIAGKKKDLFSKVRQTITDQKEKLQKERDAFIQAHPDPNALSSDDRRKDAELKRSIADIEYNEEFIDTLESNNQKKLSTYLQNTQGLDEFLSDGLIDQQMRDSGLAENDVRDFKDNVRELQKLIQMREQFVKRLSLYLMKSYEEKKTQLEQADSVKKKMDEAHEQLEVKRDVQLEILKNRKYQEEIDAIDSFRGFIDALDAHKDNKEWRNEAMATSPYGQMKLAYDAATSELTLRIAGILANGGNPGFRLPTLNYIDKAFENSHSVEEALDINNPIYQDIEGLGDYLYTPAIQPQYTREATHNLVLGKILENLNKAIKALDLKQKTSTPEYTPQPAPLPQGKGKGKGRGKGKNQGQQMYEEDLDLDKQQEKIKGQKGVALRPLSDKGSSTDREKSGLEFDPIPASTAKKLNAALDVIFQDPDKVPQYKGDIIKILKKQVIDKSKVKNKNYNLEQFIGEYLESRDMSIPEAWNLKYTPKNGSIDDASEPGRVDYDASDADSKPSNPSIEYIKKKRVASENKSSVGKKKYLRSNTTQYALYNADDEKTGTLLRYSDLLKANLKAKGLSDEAILNNPLYKRQVAVEQYLERTGAYERVNSGYVHAGKNPTEIFFTIDPALNAQAGTTVILMVDKDGNVLGDMPTNAEEYENLPLVIEAITKEWENAGSPNLDANWRFSKSTKVAQVLNGRPIYTSEHHSIGDIKGKDSNIVYGVVKNNLVITGVKEIDDNNQVLTPLNLASGTPVICIPNGNFGNQSGYTTVPIYIPNFTVEGESKLHNTKLFETIMNNIQAVVQAKTADQLKNAVKNLSRNLYLPGYDFYLLVDLKGKLKRMNTSTQGDPVKIGVQVFENGKPKSILAPIDIVTDVNDPNNSRDLIAQALNGAMIRLRRYVMNSAPATLYDLDYRALYDEAFETNLPENTRHTVNNWFICDPINLEGENPPAEKIASLGVNPTGVEARLVAVTIDSKRYIVDISNEYKVTLDDVEVQDADEVRARAQAYKEYTLTGKNPIVKKGGKKVYQTNYGEIDAETLKFYPIKKELSPSLELDEDDLLAIIAQLQGRGASLKPSKPIEKPNPAPESTEDEDDLESMAQLAAGQNGATLEQSPLNPETSNVEQKPEDTENPAEAGARSARAARNRRRGGANRQYRVAEVRNPKQKIDVDKELNWLKKRLPLFEDFVQLRNGLIENRAWGQFENGIITLSTDSGVGTTYHEAFHAVSLTLLTQEEREAIYKAARERFGNLSDVELEEKLAEDFREYVQYEESGLIGKLRHIWRKLQHMINQLFGNMDVLNKLYYDINNGSYASRVSLAEAQQYQNIRAYHTAKFMYSNLTPEQRAYLYDNGISARLYNNMPLDEKEILFYCM